MGCHWEMLNDGARHRGRGLVQWESEAGALTRGESRLNQEEGGVLSTPVPSSLSFSSTEGAVSDRLGEDAGLGRAEV